jgi:acid phosphatase type 7
MNRKRIVALLAIILLISGITAGWLARQFLERQILQTPSQVVVAQPDYGHTIVAVGDIACPAGSAVTPVTCQQVATGQLAASLKPEAVLALGDLQYPTGTLNDFQNSYDKAWGALKSVTHPVPGNHEYITRNAAGYYDYFGSLAGEREKGYYSFDIGAWHIIALNSEIDVSDGSPQRLWLQLDLQKYKNPCTLAYWHKPRFSTGYHVSNDAYAGLWQDLYNARADIVLGGHSHGYERFVAQDPSGKADAAGITEFVVGTGGASWETLRDKVPTLATRQATTFGVLKLTLNRDSANYSFMPIAGGPAFHDDGIVQCH